MDYDVLILGGGIMGCAIAYKLSKYNINIALIEKSYDIGNDLSHFNTSVIYDGSETFDDNMSGLEIIGSGLIRKHCENFNIKYNKVGVLRTSQDKYINNKFEQLYECAQKRGIRGVHLLTSNDTYNIEPNFNVNVNKAFYSENVALISSYNLAVSYAEVAVDNGVNFRLEEEVIDIKNNSNGFTVTTNKNKFNCKFVINTISNHNCDDKNKDITDKKIKYILLDQKPISNVNGIIVNEINNNTFIVNSSILFKENLIRDTSDSKFKSKLKLSKKVLEYINKQFVNNIFTEVYNSVSGIFIDDNDYNGSYINIRGGYYAKVTIAPAIALEVENKIKKYMNITQKKDYINKKREMHILRNMSKEQMNKIIRLDERYGSIICNCNNVSEGEIIDSIRRPLGARTVEAVKRRTGMGMGTCNGSYCNVKIMKILAREMNKSILNVEDNCTGSTILSGRIKEFNEI